MPIHYEKYYNFDFIAIAKCKCNYKIGNFYKYKQIIILEIKKFLEI